MTDLSDGQWTFYDSWAAFPLNQRAEKSNIVGEFMVGLDAPGGGTYGEFAISFYQFSVGDTAARIEAFGDSWRALASGGLIDALAALDGQPQGPDEMRTLLLGLGYRDRTAELRGNHPITCPTCRGSDTVE